MARDRPRLRDRLRRLGSYPEPAREEEILALRHAIEASAARREQRLRDLPEPRFPAELPVVQKKDDIATAIHGHQVVVVCGETGSGKTTQLPKICLELGRGVTGLIGHTQPRRIAARSVADRIARELTIPLGEVVGYKVRFSDRTSPGSYIKLMTDGILLAEIQGDRWLRQYDTLIIDEAHERSLNIDFLLGYLKSILPRRPDLKIVITSATIDPARFSCHFDDAPVIEVSGRSHPVKIRYRPRAGQGDDRDVQQGILDAVDELSRLGPGDILVFLPGERQIREAAEALRKHHPAGAQILPLYARLSTAEQNRVFQPHGARRIVLATNVAETSLTVPGIRYVVDAGTVRISRYSVRAKVQRLPIEPVSQASARQRAGRCGRTAPGVCIRLYDEEDFDNRPAFTEPEIRRTNLAAVILRMHQLGLGEIESFPFVDPPDGRYINDGYRLLYELGAMDEDRRITALGRTLARLPVDPRLGRMVLAAREHGCLREVLVIASALSVQDPRERPLDRQRAADEQHRRFQDRRSDFIALLRLWDHFQDQRRHLSQNKLRKLCAQSFVSWNRLREWQDIHAQLRTQVLEMGMRENTGPAEYTPLHQALLTGLLGHIGTRDEAREFLGTRNRRFMVFPGSGLAERPPKWIMAAELAETRRLYARTVARIEPGWVERAAPHLVRREYLEPHWQERSSQVGAFERLTLYGLVVVPRRRVNYGPVNPQVAREIFIREALVQGRLRTRPAFLEHNRALIDSLHDKEARSRRRDILVDEEAQFGFYDRLLPRQICNGPALERWLGRSANARSLLMTRADLMRHDAREITAQRFPDTLPVAGTALPMEYRFEPGDERDGVTLTVPLALLNQVDEERCHWLVPGLLEEKIIALIRALPKAQRRNFVPAPDYARACLESVSGQGDLFEALSLQLLRMSGVEIDPDTWRGLPVDDHLRMRFRITDGQGETLAEGRDLGALKTGLVSRIEEHFSALSTADSPPREIRQWDFGTLDRPVEMDHAGIRVRGWPALVRDGTALRLQVLDTREGAELASAAGILRLYRVVLAEQDRYLLRSLPDIQSMCLLFRSIGGCDALRADLVETAFQRVFLDGRPLPRDRCEFEARLDEGRDLLVTAAGDLCTLVHTILRLHHQARKDLRALRSPSALAAVQDMDQQLGRLVYAGFVLRTPAPWLARMPRYLKAVSQRIEKLAANPERDRQAMRSVVPWWERCVTRLDGGGDVTRDPEFVQMRWMVEEFRVSCFAQALGTAVPVSDQRLEAQWRRIRPR